MRAIIPRRSPADLRAMRAAGRVVAEMHGCIREAIRPGVTTGALDRIGRSVLERRGAQSNFLGYHGYPAVICASINNVVVHGIPGDGPDETLDEGDIVSIDCGAIVEGWHGDAAFTAGVGEISADAARLIEVADQALAAAIDVMVPGNRVGDIGAAVEGVVVASGFDFIRDYCGHGIGRAMHEWPDVPNFGRPGRGPRLAAGSVLAVEPMVVAGRAHVYTFEDGWGVATDDDGWAAHAEHTIAVTDNGPEILTLP
jgi:methionyl aminopeptidase